MLVYSIYIHLYYSDVLKHRHLMLFYEELNVVNVDLADFFHWGPIHI